MTELEISEPDDYSKENSELAADLVRLCPHLSPDLQRAIDAAIFDGPNPTIH
jgi:hypothetical protein